MFLVLEASTVGSTKDMLTPQSSAMTELKPEQAVPETPLHQLSDPNMILVLSATLGTGAEILLQVCMIDNNVSRMGFSDTTKVQIGQG